MTVIIVKSIISIKISISIHKMEVTNLKVLKKLMKGDASRKFEFEEDADLGSYDKNGMLFEYGTGKAKGGATYQHTFGNSHKDRGGSDEEDMAYE